MKIAVVGRGNVGSLLADLWGRSGHEVTTIGRDGADVSEADAVLLAVPGEAISDALDGLRGRQGKTVLIDPTNLLGVSPPEGFPSNAEWVKTRTGGPTAKAFNTIPAAVYGRLDETTSRPNNLWCGDEEAREAVELLSRDAGFESLYAGPLENAAEQEALATGNLISSVFEGLGEPFVYRFAPPDRL
jgi:predicted dinucleotide-binding enzyme